MTWRHKETGHQQLWHWPNSTGIRGLSAQGVNLMSFKRLPSWVCRPNAIAARIIRLTSHIDGNRREFNFISFTTEFATSFLSNNSVDGYSVSPFSLWIPTQILKPGPRAFVTPNEQHLKVEYFQHFNTLRVEICSNVLKLLRILLNSLRPGDAYMLQ